MTSTPEVDGDVFTQSPVVDIEVLEAAKENIQPLASGRRVTTLSAILSTPHAQREAQLVSTRKRHRVNVEIALQDEDDDPLEAYVRFVNWILDNYPQGQSSESGLLELLEEATRVLKDDRGGIWKGELKYLKLWLLYASFVEKPTLIFKFLLANDIGTNHAILYEEYAAVLERSGCRGEADATFLLGIARQAQPLEHLQGKHAEFQKRMMSGIALPAQAQEPATSGPRRAALGLTASSVSSTQGDVFGSNQSSRPAQNSRLQIFMDPMGSEPQDETRTAFPDIGTRKSRVKENVPEVRKAAGTTLKHVGRSRRIASTTSSSSISKIVPYKDPDPGESVGSEAMPPPPVPSSRIQPQTPARMNTVLSPQDPGSKAGEPSTPRFTPFRDEPDTPSTSTTPAPPDTIMKPKIANGRGSAVLSEAEALRKDPLKNYTVNEFSLMDD
ncbi:Mad3/BUB1 homology region 1-domain-containing protein [Scleroderma yunnanense]